MNKQRIAGQSVRVPLCAREGASAARLRPELEEQIRGRQPASLHSILRQLAAQEGLVDERLVHEVPVVRVNFVHVADCREEPSALDGEAVVQGQRLEIRLLDIDAVVALDGGRDVGEEVRVDVGGDGQLRLPEIEAAVSGALPCRRRNESRDPVGRRIL